MPNVKPTPFNFDLKSIREMITGLGKEEIIIHLNSSIDENKFIYGPAGSGKTSIAITVLNKILGDKPNSKILFLVYGNFLRGYIQQTVPNLAKYVESYEKFIYDLPFGNTFEERFNNFHPKYDYIVIDEAQDVHIDFIKHIHLIATHIFILGDNGQRIFLKKEGLYDRNTAGRYDNPSDYNCKYEDVYHRNISWSEHIIEYLNLPNNDNQQLNWIRRYPKNIHDFAIQFKADNGEYNFIKPRVEDKSIITYFKEANQENEIQRIIKIITNILETEPNSSIGIIVDLQTKVEYLYNELIEKGIQCTKYTSNVNREHRERNREFGENIEIIDNPYYSPFITTLQSSKGTDANYIILPNIIAPENYCPEGRQYASNCVNYPLIFLKDEHFYVLATRAKKKIYITGHGANLNLEQKITSRNFDKNTYKTIYNSN